MWLARAMTIQSPARLGAKSRNGRHVGDGWIGGDAVDSKTTGGRGDAAAATPEMDAFRGCVGQSFSLADVSGAVTELLLREVEDLGEGASRRAFSLIFEGRLQPIHPQAIYRLDNQSLGPLDIFLVPLGPHGDRCRYQAVFT